ncbi:chromosome segregation protein SMC [Candidatus Poribacteria bacterium]|nr:MAG: chromosome segregation protein SMC [Candidatus Poribacteria bacterium]
MKDSTFIKRVILKNYKSIAACDVQLQPLTFLVGRNGSGKSNFLDALRLVADALNSSLDHALRARGGINDVRCRSRGHPTHFSIRFEFVLPDGSSGHYAFRIGTCSQGGYEVQKEQCKLHPDLYYHIDKGTVTHTNVKVAPAAASDRLYLVNASGLPEFRPVYDAFSRMGFYNLNPDKIRDLQVPDHSDMLIRDGSNLASVFVQLPPDVKQDIQEYLSIIVPGVRGVEVEKFGDKEMLVFRQDVVGDKHPWRFHVNNMSDGTLRLLGILVALFQGNHDTHKHVSLVGIEEPEIVMHPAMVGALLDEFQNAAYNTQVIITTHSPDLLDEKSLNVDSILVAEVHDGNTVIAPVDDVCRSVVHDKMFTVGDLLRRDQLEPAPEFVSSTEKAKQLSLFNF